MNSIPVGIVELGFGFDDYSGMARNVRRVLNMRRSWDSILKGANSELSEWSREIGSRLPLDMAHDREFFREAGLKYSSGIPIQGCFSVAVADYMLRNRDRLELSQVD